MNTRNAYTLTVTLGSLNYTFYAIKCISVFLYDAMMVAEVTATMLVNNAHIWNIRGWADKFCLHLNRK